MPDDIPTRCRCSSACQWTRCLSTKTR